VTASARGLSKLAVIMANKGHFRGKRLLSEETWDKMHSSPK
jgi:CubicO group peptidase (beta-lactamase class C family)